MPRRESETWPFVPYARLISLLGEQLIQDSTIALFELAKNAYDADSPHVHVILEGEPASSDDPDVPPAQQSRGPGLDGCRVHRIIVADAGHGMTKSQLQEGWMRLGVSDKAFRDSTGARHQRRSRSGQRVQLGEKGVGRFATARLGAHLDIYTRAENEECTHCLECRWDAFSASDTMLIGDDALGACYRRLPAGHRAELTSHGTRLEISDIRSPDWSKEQLEDLDFNLATLVNPLAERRDFDVHLVAPVPYEPLDMNIVQRAHYVVRAVYHDEGGECRVEGTLHVRYTGETLPIRLKAKTEAGACGPFVVELAVFERSADELRHAAIGKLQQKLLKRYAGISIYRDGFRLLPYGLPDNDWLRLDARRVSRTGTRLSNSQIIGQITITAQANPGLEDQTHRQGLVQNEAFHALCSVTRETLIREVERLRVRILAPARKARSVSLGELDQHVKALADLAKTHGDADERRAADQLRTWVRDTRQRMELYVRIAASGIAAEMATHDIEQVLRRVRRSGRTLQQELERCTGVTDQAVEAASAMRAAVETLSTSFAVLKPMFARGRVRTTTFRVAEPLADVLRLFDLHPNRDGIEVRTDVASSVEATMVVGHLHQVLINILDNAFYWVEKGDPPYVVSIEISRKNGRPWCIISNSGPPIDEEDLDFITEPFYTTRREDASRGLGLYIVSDILANLSKKLHIRSEGDLGGPVFSFELPTSKDE